MITNSKKLNWFLILITALLCYFPLCHRIDILCIQLWDEGRNVTNAIEMINNNHWAIRYFENQPDMWELKPPLLIWCQVLSFKIFGYSELAARLPSLFFSCATVALLVWFSKRITGKIEGGIISCLILVSSKGYIGVHGVRFGDHEAALAFFTTALICFSYLFFITRLFKYLGIAFLSLFFGWLTKSIVIFMFIPALFFWAVVNKYLLNILKRKDFWICSLTMLVLISIYYLYREKESPGYMHKVWMNELFGRFFGYSKDYTYNNGKWYYYFENFIKSRFSPFVVFVIIGTPIVLIKSTLKYQKLLFYLLINIWSFLFIISLGTKNFWYDLPLYPIASLFSGIVIITYLEKIIHPLYRKVYCFSVFIIIFIGYLNSFNYPFKPEKHDTENWRSLCYFLREKKNSLPKHLKIIHNGYYAPLYLYIEKLKERKILITILKKPQLELNDTFLITDQNLIRQTDSLFNVVTLLQKENCFIKVVKSVK